MAKNTLKIYKIGHISIHQVLYSYIFQYICTIFNYIVHANFNFDSPKINFKIYRTVFEISTWNLEVMFLGPKANC